MTEKGSPTATTAVDIDSNEERPRSAWDDEEIPTAVLDDVEAPPSSSSDGVSKVSSAGSRNHVSGNGENVEGGVVNPGLSLDEGPDVVTVDTNSKPKMAKRENSAYLRRQQAVSVRRAFKAYGSSKAPNHILQNLNMTVEKGTIYGLLGASGCGKTTLLSCIVGRRRLDNGEIFVLGGKPGHKGSGVPGKRVGYMPQEIALYGEFSIKETMMYFGWIFGMESSDIIDRLTFLLNFLDLPSQSRLVKNLSGGQQRRVSFAVALMHDPELLILDEPTVGVDPLLRQSIWNHLVQISKDGNKTVIITTHYIEEARQAHTIGLMRSGKLLAEEAPATLLTMYNCSSLEEVFLKLSRIQGQQNSTNDELLAKNMNLATLHWGKNQEPVYVTEESGVVGLNFHQKKEPEPTSNGYYIQEDQDEKNQGGCNKCLDLFKLTTKGKTKALLQKNFLRMWRNVGVMLFIFALPVMQVILFCLAIGRDPTGLHLAIVNDEVTRNNLTMETCPVYSNCTIKFLSCRYISSLRTDTIIKDYYPDLDSAIQAIKDGKVWGALYFNANYSKELMARVLLGTGADEDTLEQSDIKVWMDMSSDFEMNWKNENLVFNHLWLAAATIVSFSLFRCCDYYRYIVSFRKSRSHPGRIVLIIDEYRRLEDALDAVKQGDAWGVIHFNENFTDALSARMILGQTSDEETLEESQFSVWLDMSNQQIGLMLNRDLQFAYRTFAQNMLTSCGNNPKVADIPIQFQEPIYGSNDPSFTDFVAPGVILTIVFFLAVALTSSALIIERMEGLLDRSWVAGVMPHEVLFSHVITQFVVMCGQTALVLIFMISVFNVQCEGNIFLVVLLTILQGLCGMCFGFVISAVCELERNAIQLALGSFYPTLLLSGVIWPVEGMPVVLRYISYCLPLTLATTSLRAMMSRGWGFGEPDVYYGYMSTIIWIVAFLTVALMVLKMKKG